MIPGSMIEPATSERSICRRLHPQLSVSMVCHSFKSYPCQVSPCWPKPGILSTPLPLLLGMPFALPAFGALRLSKKSRFKALDNAIILLYNANHDAVDAIVLLLAVHNRVALPTTTVAGTFPAHPDSRFPFRQEGLCALQKTLLGVHPLSETRR